MAELTHTDLDGKSRMVDVGDKEITKRIAIAYCEVHLSKEAFKSITDNTNRKGDVLAVAKIAAIQSAKKTSELIPLCHNISLNHVDINFQLDDIYNRIIIISEAKTEGKTGVEMEALTAVSVAGLTIYDMCKSIDKTIIISDIKLLEKSGGKSGHYKKDEKTNE